ncbi:MAG: PPC domain-containing protein, partial [Kiritimatiellales bacterium]
AQDVTLPVIINGRIETPGDRDVFRFTAQKGDTLVAEVNARRLDSPLDSLLTLTDRDGKQVAINDDHSDPGSGLNTHHADSYIRAELPADGTYYVHLTDTAHQGGPDSTYRLRLSPPQPDFALRTEPSRIDLRGNNAAVNIYAIRKDGFNGPITLRLKEPVAGFDAKPVTLPAKAEKIQFNIRYTGKDLKGSIPAVITGTAQIGNKQKIHEAVPAEDWMQAFLWRHLVPAQELVIYRYDRSMSPPTRPLPPEPDISLYMGNLNDLTPQQKQVATQIKQTVRLYEEWLLTDDLYQATIRGYLDFTTEKKPEEKTVPPEKSKSAGSN